MSVTGPKFCVNSDHAEPWNVDRSEQINALLDKLAKQAYDKKNVLLNQRGSRLKQEEQ